MTVQLIYPYCGVQFTSSLSHAEVANLISHHLLNGVPISESHTVLESPSLAIEGTFLGMKIRINELEDSKFGFCVECRRLDLIPMSDELDLDAALSDSASEADRFPSRANLSSYIAALLDEIEGIDVVWSEDLHRPSL